MKINSKLLALCVFHLNVLGSAAFVQKQKAFAVKSQTARPSSLFSSRRNLDGDGVSDRTALSSSLSNSNMSYASASSSNRLNASTTGETRPVKNIWATPTQIIVQGGSLRTWSIANPAVERVQVLMNTEGRPLNADVELWHGPDNTPQRMRVYVEDGSLRRFCAVIDTPRGHNAIAIRNTGHLEFPLNACVNHDLDDDSGTLRAITETSSSQTKPKIIQGGAVHTYPFAPSVASVQLILKTDGRPLNARVELMQGPNNNKQVMEVYTEDGRERPFCAVLETPGIGNVVRIVNTASVEFPMYAVVEPYHVDPSSTDEKGISGWDNSGASASSSSPLIMDRQW